MTARRPDPPPAVRWIARTLEDAGHETWAVGGAVRDAFLGRTGGDWDLATHARPNQVRKLFRRTVPIGIEHGTVGVLAKGGVMYEVTTFRRDVETDGRHAVVHFAETIEEDLARRDFTINALAWHPLRDELLDPFAGQNDLREGQLRTVGLPADRFREDYLRILRALRFAGRFGFGVEPRTWEALRAGTDALTGLSAERVREELTKVLEADPKPSGALHLYRTSGALAVLYPELHALDDDVWARTLGAVDALPLGRPFLRLAGLFRPLDPDVALGLLSRMRLSNAQVDEALHRVAAPPLPGTEASAAEMRGWLARTGPERLTSLARLDLASARANAGNAQDVPTPAEVVDSWRRAKEVRRSGAPLSMTELALKGRDLIRMGYRPGPHFGDVLDALLERVLESPELNDPETLAALATELLEDSDG